MNIIITGASRGIGYELVKSFIKESDNKVFAISRNTNSLNKLKEISDNVIPFSFDLLEINEKSDVLLSKINEYLPKIDILINNAGFLVRKPFNEISVEEVNKMFQVNLFSPVTLVKLLKDKLSKNSHIVNIGSMAGFQGSSKFPGLSYYSASKGAISTITECLAEELKESGVKVNSLALGAVATEMLAEAFPGYKAPVTAAEMAKYISDFAKNGHKLYNGKVLPVSGNTP